MPSLKSMDPALNCQQSLLQKDQSRGAGNSTVPARSLKNDWYLPPQQNTGAARDLFMQWRKKLRTCRGDVATQNEQLGIEHVQEAYQRGRKRLESEVQHAPRARVALCRRLKDSLGTGNPASFVN